MCGDRMNEVIKSFKYLVIILCKVLQKNGGFKKIWLIRLSVKRWSDKKGQMVFVIRGSIRLKDKCYKIVVRPAVMYAD